MLDFSVIDVDTILIINTLVIQSSMLVKTTDFEVSVMKLREYSLHGIGSHGL